MSAARWRGAMNTGAGRLAWQRPATGTRLTGLGGGAGRLDMPAPGVTGLPPGTPGATGLRGRDAARPHWLGAISQYVAARHVLILVALLFFPVVATPFFTYQIAARYRPAMYSVPESLISTFGCAPPIAVPFMRASPMAASSGSPARTFSAASYSSSKPAVSSLGRYSMALSWKSMAPSRFDPDSSM